MKLSILLITGTDIKSLINYKTLERELTLNLDL
jgi:hypothetical protein